MMEIQPIISDDGDSGGFFSDLSQLFSEHTGFVVFSMLVFLLCGLGLGFTLYKMNPVRSDKEEILDATLE